MALLVGGLGFVAKLLHMAKDLVVAGRFGTSGDLDAFILAMSFPLFTISTLAGSLNSSVVPVYVQVRSEAGEPAAHRLIGNVLAMTLPLLLVATGLLAATGTVGFLRIGTTARVGEGMRTELLFLALLPVVLLSGLSTLWASTLNASERFVAAALAPVSVSLVPVVALLVLRRLRPLDALLLGTLIGYGVETLVLAVSARRASLPVLPRWSGIDDGTRRVLRAYLPMVAGALISSSSPLVDQLMATRLGTGSVASLAYGNKVISFTLSIGLLALGTAVLPQFSRMAASNDWPAIRHTLTTYSKLVLVFSVPPTLVAMYFARPIIGLLFERGAFGAGDTRLIGLVFAAYLPQVPFALLGLLGVRLLSAMQQNRMIMLIACTNVVINFVGDYVLMGWFGLPGIALSTSIVSASATTAVFVVIWVLLRQKERADTTSSPPPTSIPAG